MLLHQPDPEPREPRHFARACREHRQLLDESMRCPGGCQITEHDKDVPVGTELWIVVEIGTWWTHSRVIATHEPTERASGKRESTTRVEYDPRFQLDDQYTPQLSGRTAAGYSPHVRTSRAAMSREDASNTDLAIRLRARRRPRVSRAA